MQQLAQCMAPSKNSTDASFLSQPSWEEEETILIFLFPLIVLVFYKDLLPLINPFFLFSFPSLIEPGLPLKTGLSFLFLP